MGRAPGLSARLSVLVLSMAPASLWAAGDSVTSHTPVQISGYVIKMLVSMGLVLGLLAAFAWYARRYGLGNYSRKVNDQLKVVSMLSLGARERLVIVQAGQSQILLGLTQGNIKKLHVLPAGPADADGFGSALAAQMQAPTVPGAEEERDA